MIGILLNVLLTPIIFILFIALYYHYAFKHWIKLGIPHPKPSFPFGNLDANFSKKFGQIVANIYFDMKKKGHAYCGYYMFAMPVFMPIDHKMNKHLLVENFNSFTDHGFHSDEKNDPMGASLLTWSGEKWKIMRQKLSPTFSAGKTKMMLPIVMKCTKELENVIDKKVRLGEPINIQDIGKRYTVDVICACAFGVEGNCLKDPNAEFIRHAKMIFTTNIVENMRLFVGEVAPIVSKIFKIDLFNSTATSFFRKVVHETVAYREQNNIEREDFLNLMIRLKNNKSIEDGEEKSSKVANNDTDQITVDQIAAQCFVFFIGGFETTSSTIKYLLFELAKNEDIQQKVREEVLAVLKKYDNEWSYEAVREMRYLKNVVLETLRLYPIVHMLNRICTEDFTIPDTNITIKKGTRAVLSTLGVHMDPEFYPNPEKFNPNRFTDEAKATRPSYVYLPFGAGPRICPGLRFGIMEVKICVASLLLKFKFSNHPTCKELRICSIGNFLGTENPVLLTAERLRFGTMEVKICGGTACTFITNYSILQLEYDFRIRWYCSQANSKVEFSVV